MVTFYKEIPDDQRMVYSVIPKKGALLRARMLGRQIEALADLMRACGDEDGQHLETFVVGIGMDEEGTVRFELATLPRLDDDDPEAT